MFLSLVMTASLLGQTPPPDPDPATLARQKALLEQIHKRTAAPEAQAKLKREKARQKASTEAAAARYEAQRPQREAEARARYEREKIAFQQNQKAQQEAQRQYERALPLLLENQRQQLERLSAYERNLTLQRMAASSERIAKAIELDVAARQNARMGYSTPALTTSGPGVTTYPYGSPGSVMYTNPLDNMTAPSMPNAGGFN